MPIAAMWGTSVGYTDLGYSVIIETTDGRVRATSRETFDLLYYRLDGITAALKEDCIEYIIYETDKPLVDYPEWYIEAYDNGYVFEDEDYPDFILYNSNGDILMSNGSMVLKNFKGDLMYMEPDKFDKYYDTDMQF